MLSRLFSIYKMLHGIQHDDTQQDNILQNLMLNLIYSYAVSLLSHYPECRCVEYLSTL